MKIKKKNIILITLLYSIDIQNEFDFSIVSKRFINTNFNRNYVNTLKYL